MAAKKKNFENSLERLEEIVTLMENGDADLEQTVKLYTEGVELSVYCAGKLKDIEQKVSVLQKNAQGAFEKQNFNSNGTEEYDDAT
jgi:exodeoxyribonuclease VII small subunit